MGRRARTNASPIDNALEKYHNDIGNRLSGLFVPPLPTLEEPSDFAMLTLDTRHRNNIRIKNKDSPIATHKFTDADSSSPTTNIMLSSNNSKENDISLHTKSPLSTAASTTSSSHSDNDILNNKDKRGLVDKVTRALFQRKHTCTRCQRKSRSCLPNKNFNGTEKHYMCDGCRENSYAIKRWFTDTSSPISSKDSSLSNSSKYLTPSHPLRKQLNDSGYETVTSCSTVASAYSAFTNAETPEKVAANNAILGHLDAPCPHVCQHATPQPVPSSYHQSQPVVQEISTSQPENEDAPGIHQFLAPDGVLRQVTTKHTKHYDGYLPTHYHHHHHHHHHTEENTGVLVVRPPLSDSTNASNNSQGATHDANSQRSSQPSLPKSCYTCRSSSKPCFRLPWAGGWLCEDCMDGMC